MIEAISRAFTVEYPNVVNAIVTPVRVGPLVAETSKITADQALERAVECNALWDTGATNTVVTQKIIDLCGLQAMGVIPLSTPNGVRLSLQYLVSLFLPGRVASFPSLLVCEGDIAGADVLIGMDIISLGDFAIGSPAGKTVFSFRMPSQQAFDFRTQPMIQLPNPVSRKVGRNDPCPCGSGKKYKSCHGKTA